MKFLKKFWWLLLIVLIIVLAIYFPAAFASLSQWIGTMWQTFLTFLSELSWWQLALLGLGVGFIIDPEGTTRLLTSVAGWVGETVGSVVGAVAKGLGLGPLLLLGVGAYLVFFREDDSGRTFVERRRDSKREDADYSVPAVAAGGAG